MKPLIKPKQLRQGDKIAVVSPCNGWAGDPDIRWKYNLGVSRLQKLGLEVIVAPNTLKGSEYLSKNPGARAEDIMWAFENKEVHGVIANIGGFDSIKVIPYIQTKSISENPKIFIGYSDVMNLHLLCYHCGLSSFYGDNLLNPIADQSGWHEYSKKWFVKALFDTSPFGQITPSPDWTFEPADYINPECKRTYYPNSGYQKIQGKGIVQGRLIGGHTGGLMELAGTSIELTTEDFEEAILFVEDIPEFFDEVSVQKFFSYLGEKGILQKINGIIIGKVNENRSFEERAKMIYHIISDEYSCSVPVLYGLNFGHSSPMFVLPYGAMAEIDCEKTTFSILESGVTVS